MKALRFLLIGLFFGIILSWSEAISWYRIYEMFRFQSFHMYGIIGSAVITGAIAIQWSKRKIGAPFEKSNPPKQGRIYRYLIGGTIFGLGWALTGACPGPLWILVGNGVFSVVVVIAAAILGTFVYGLLRDKLPH